MHRDPPHYLRALTTDTTPRRLLWLDCEAATGKEHGTLVDRWASGVLGRTWWTSKREERRDRIQFHTVSADLWSAAADFCRPGRRVVLFAYDLAWQLRVSRALVELPALGFHLDKIVLERTAAWALFRDDKRSLMCCDLKSWLPISLDRIRADLEHDRRLVITADHGGPVADAGPVIRAHIVREAVLQILEWVRAERLGPFRPTGSGQSYSAYRRRFLADRLLVHDDTERLAYERAAMWTGRCEAWRHGTIPGGPFTEYDLHAAHLSIAAECQIPGVAYRVIKRPRPARLFELCDQYAVMAEVEITTRVPVVPARLGDRTAWPVGTFRTVLWEPELALAAEYADAIRCERAWLYHRSPALRAFARWTLAAMDGSQDRHGQLPARVAKHWSRTLVGRLGLRFREWQPFGQSPDLDLRLVTYIDVNAGTATDLLQAGHDLLILAGMTEARDSLPQIPGWVMAECRRRLWRAMAHVGLDRVLYVDTDSMILLPAPGWETRPVHQTLTDAGWCHKGTYRHLTIHGPRNLVAQSTRRVAGLPLSARQVAPLEFTGEIMRSIKESVKAGELDHVAHIPRRFVLDAPDLRRQHNPDGTTTPYRLEVRPNGPITSADVL